MVIHRHDRQRQSLSAIIHEKAPVTLYKPKLLLWPGIKRRAARAMAMMDISDGLFEDVEKALKDKEAIVREEYKQLIRLYGEPSHGLFHDELNMLLLSGLHGIAEVKFEDLERCVLKEEYPKLFKQAASTSFLLAEPVSLYIAYLIKEFRTAFRKQDVLSREDLTALYKAMGEAQPQS